MTVLPVFRRFTKGIALFALGSALILPSSLVNAADISEDAFAKAMEAYLAKDDNVEKVSNSIQQFFSKKKDEQAVAAAKAQEQKMEDQFKNPVKVEIGDSPFKGPKDAKVEVVAFSDFQCPYCSKGKDIVDQLAKEYPKDVKIAFKHLPLDFHPQAMPASKASFAAGKQGKFWEMHDYIFDNQSKLSDAFYPEAAKELKLDLAKFKKDFEDPATEARIQKDLDQAKALGVQGTPNFFINGVNLRGAYPLPEFKKVIDKWLEKK